ncbi:MAG: hypothetical protein A2V66_05360 [Ignavibacteria bacterium RBG_13_36_8]|nr:MAG: hypothetical protein A2V66_05360 [Ignavibacteria bacterium RBG_13_36_8]
MLKNFKINLTLAALIFVTLFVTDSYSQTTKVLFIGSSLTGFNGQPVIFNELATAAGKEVLVVNGARAGHNLTDHLSVPETVEKINQEKWDYVVLENGDYGLMYEETRAEVWTTIGTFINMIHANCSTTKIIIFMDWAMKYGVSHNGMYYSYEIFQQMIYNATMDVARDKNLIVAPIGSAWRSIVNTFPGIELYAPDNGHPSLGGSYLGACVYYSVIFQESVVGNNYFNTIPETEAQNIQSVASSTVLENLGLWNIVTSVDLEDKDYSKNFSFHLFQNFPNPFNPSTTISFELIGYCNAELLIYNSVGERIYSFLHGETLSPGLYSFSWNGKNDSGNQVGAGTYFYSFRTGNFVVTKGMILLK